MEYAIEAISHAGSAVGILSKEGVVLAAEKKILSKVRHGSALARRRCCPPRAARRSTLATRTAACPDATQRSAVSSAPRDALRAIRAPPCRCSAALLASQP